MAPPSGFYLHRPSNSQWIATRSPESAGQTFGLGLYQGFVDFDMLGPQFYVMMSGHMGSDGTTMTWYVRIGGTYLEASELPEAAPDGDQVTIGSVTVGAFDRFSMKVLVTNIWSGVQHVKLTGSAAASCQCPTLIFLPVL